jgi:hypothetical protein
MTIMHIPLAKSGRNVASKYDVIFANLERGSDQCHVEKDVVQADKVAARMNSAVTAYRNRTGDTSAFAVRTVTVDGSPAVAVWRLASDLKPRRRAEKA